MPGTLKLKSEAGGSVILAANTTAASDLTVSVPPFAGTMATLVSNTTGPTFSVPNVVGNGPAFSAYKSGTQSFTQNSWTKATFNLEEYDTNSNFDTTNSRFLPTVAGYYQISCTGYINGSSTDLYMQLYKNGSGMSPPFYVNASITTSNFTLSFSNLIYLNGSTDYLELWVYSNGASPSLNNSGTHFQGYLARSA